MEESKKQLIKEGMLAKLRNGTTCYLSLHHSLSKSKYNSDNDKILINYNNNWECVGTLFNDYDDDLLHKSNRDLDIIRVLTVYHIGSNFIDQPGVSKQKIIYKREETED